MTTIYSILTFLSQMKPHVISSSPSPSSSSPKWLEIHYNKQSMLNFSLFAELTAPFIQIYVEKKIAFFSIRNRCTLDFLTEFCRSKILLSGHAPDIFLAVITDLCAIYIGWLKKKLSVQRRKTINDKKKSNKKILSFVWQSSAQIAYM